jgi:transposase-like protein
VHKTANVLNKVALSVQPSMKRDLREVWLSPNREAAETAIDVLSEKYGAKYPKAVECLSKDRQTLLAFYDFRRNIGIICARRTRSKACFRRFVTGRFGRRDRFRRQPPN